MTFRAVVQGGIIRTGAEFPNGARVRVTLDRATKRRKKQKPRARRAKKEVPFADLPAFGMWKNRKEWKGKSSVEVVRELREKALGRHRRG